MSTTTAIVFWTAAFAATHMGLASIRVRPHLVRRLGEGPYLLLYSVISFATFVPIVMAWMQGIHGGGLLWNVRDVPGVSAAGLVVSFVSFTLAIAAIFQPGPVAVGPRVRTRAYGVTRITRHPLFMNIGVWAFAHVVLNGFVNDVLFFGGVALVGLLGCMHQDARKKITEKGTLDEFYAETSLLPFVAIASGRTKLVVSELPWLGMAVGAAISLAIYWYHAEMFF
jgi:uncharacterized membrane protein